MKLKNQVAIVTGAGRGIGSAIAIQLAKEGAVVVVNYNESVQGAKRVLKEIERLEQKAIAVRANVSKPRAVNTMVKTTLASFGRIDILVNNAGIAPFVPFLELSEEVWDKTIDTNLKGTFLCSQAVAKVMVKQKGGKIINITSVGAEKGQMFLAHYDASKGGMNSLTKAMATELGSYGINVVAVGPGPIAIERNLKRIPNFREVAGKQLPLRKVGEAEDIAKIVTFLASQDAKFITGQILYVDGGLLAQLQGLGGEEYI